MQLTLEEKCELYKQVLFDKDIKAQRELCCIDLFFLLLVACNRKDLKHPWLFDRCNEVQAEPDGYLDLWSREHYKSTILTFAKTIQDILINPEITVGIFSHTRPIAKAFLNQIKREFETNEGLKELFPDILFSNPQKEASIWSLDSGIVVKRKSNPKEATVEAHGLVDGQPTSKHYSLLVYDDVVTLSSVTTTDMIEKVTNAWAISLNLAAVGGKQRYVGTRYHFNDTYKTIMARGVVKPRFYPATEDGKPTGKPVLISAELLETKRQSMGSYVFASQMLQNPTADSAQGFKLEWLRYFDPMEGHKTFNKYIIVDPANEKKKENDYTVMWVIGLGVDNNYYLLDGIRDRLNLTERTEKLFSLVRKHKPIKVGYEQYGLQSDIQHIKFLQNLRNYRFEIVPLGGKMPKEDRIRTLVPIFEFSRFWIPYHLYYKTYEDKIIDLIEIFKNDEYEAFPVSVHDDMLDDMARILDPEFNVIFPEDADFEELNMFAHQHHEEVYQAI